MHLLPFIVRTRKIQSFSYVEPKQFENGSHNVQFMPALDAVNLQAGHTLHLKQHVRQIQGRHWIDIFIIKLGSLIL